MIGGSPIDRHYQDERTSSPVGGEDAIGQIGHPSSTFSTNSVSGELPEVFTDVGPTYPGDKL